MSPTPSTQRGAATLAVAVLLAVAMLVAALYVNRHLLADQRSAAQQVRTTQAFEAAEAGIAWALAQLNTSRRIGSTCLPAPGATTSFRERHLTWQSDSGSFVASGTRPACVRNAQGWTCHCPADGAGTPSADDDGQPHPGFTLTLLAGPRPGTVRLRALGCSHFARPCAPAADARSEAIAQVEVLVALLPGIARPPAAALTARDGVAATGSPGLHNADPRSGGVALHTGGGVQAVALRLTAPAGSSQVNALVTHDAVLAGAEPRELFASTFGVDRATWRAQPAATRLACPGDCGADLLAAIGDGVVNPLVAVDGGLRIDGPIEIGTPARPVVLVVDGPVQFNGAVRLHGLLYANRLQWDDTPAHGALLRGAAVLEAGYAGSGTPDIVRDAGILATLRGNTGSFVRIPGSWRDF